MASNQLQNCAVCPRATTKTCSGCQAVAFCSRDCQKVLWPSHKILCKRNPDVFYFPPLDEALVQQFDALRDKPFQGADITYQQMWARQIGVTKEWRVRCLPWRLPVTLSPSASRSPSVSSQFILDQLRYDDNVADDPSRNLLRMFALAHLYHYGRGCKLFSPPNRDAYFCAADLFHKAVTGFLNAGLAPPFGPYTQENDPFRVLNALLRALLVLGTMLARCTDDKSVVPRDIYDVLRYGVASDRVDAVLQGMSLPPVVRACMAAGDGSLPDWAREGWPMSFEKIWSEMIAGRL
ncbi:hypothetical protein JCM3770_000081 [Rhodotorula araucariae]